MRKSLLPMFVNGNKLELFRLWLLEMDGRYTTEQIEELIRRKTAQNMYICDPNFPDNENLRQYILVEETTRVTQDIREESQTLRGTTELSATEALSLTEAGASFAADGMALPGLSELEAPAATPNGAPGAHEDKGNGNKGKGRRKKGTGNDGGGENGNGNGEKPVVPLTPLQQATALAKATFLRFRF